VRVGVLSDTHLRVVDGLFSGLTDKYFSGVDALIHAGDMVDICVAQFLENWSRDRSIMFSSVSGNMDLTPVPDILPKKTVIEIGGVKIGIIHGWGEPQNLAERVMSEFTGVDAVVFGHSHRPMNAVRNKILLFNPGSPTDKRFAKDNTIGYLDIDGGDVRGEIVHVE